MPSFFLFPEEPKENYFSKILSCNKCPMPSFSSCDNDTCIYLILIFDGPMFFIHQASFSCLSSCLVTIIISNRPSCFISCLSTLDVHSNRATSIAMLSNSFFLGPGCLKF